MRWFLVALFSVVMFSVSCGQRKSGGVLLAPEAFADFMVGDGIQLIDVRTPEEFAEGHIEGATNVNYNAPNFAQNVVNEFDTIRPVALYCRSGARSHHAAVQLTSKGFTVYELDGGIMAWKGDLIP